MKERKLTNEQLAEMLYDAAKRCKAMDAISDLEPEVNLEDAYAIQLMNVSRALKDGEIVSGRKIGLTSKAMQELLGIAEPDYGYLYVSTEVKNSGTISMKNAIRPKVEGEIAFVLKEDLRGPGVTVEDVYRATDYVCASIEIVDSRIRDWKIKLVDTVADNGSSSMYILGDTKVKTEDISLTDISMTLYKNGEVVNTGTGEAVLGNPAISVAWLANKLYEFGAELNKGEVILSGAITAAPEAHTGDRFECAFSGLGIVNVNFI